MDEFPLEIHNALYAMRQGYLRELTITRDEQGKFCLSISPIPAVERIEMSPKELWSIPDKPRYYKD